jgi:competence protein ComEC
MGLNKKVRINYVMLDLVGYSAPKRYISVDGIQIQLPREGVNKRESPEELLGKRLIAIGTLKLKSPDHKFSGFTLDQAKIDISVTSLSRLQKLRMVLGKVSIAIRQRFGKSLSSLYSFNEASLVAGMLLGAKESFSPGFYNQLQQSGLLHLVAASGYNISIVVGFVGGFVGLLLKSRLIKLITVISFVLLYVIVAGTQPSVVRAGTMGVLGFFASTAGSARSSKRIFTLIALLMLLVRPSWLWDIGYQLSVAATAGLLWIEPRLGSVLRLTDRVRELSTSLAASIATLPVLISRLGWERVSWAGVLVNVPAALLVAPVMLVGAVVGGLGMVWPEGARGLAILGRPVVWGMVALVRVGSWFNELLRSSI